MGDATFTAIVTVYVVIDMRTGKQMGKEYATRSRASARADKLDNAYGAYRYRVESRTVVR